MFYVILGIIVVIAFIGFLKFIQKEIREFFINNYYFFPKTIRRKIQNLDPFKDLIWFINLMLFFLIIFQLGLLIAVKFGSTYATHALIKNIFFWFGKEAGYGKLTLMLFSTAALFIGSYNLSRFLNEFRKRNNLKGIKAVTELRKMLDENRINLEIHRDLQFGEYDFIEIPSTKDEKTKQIELFCYLRTIEQAKFMIQKRIIDIEQFYKQFGSRIDDIVKCEPLKEYLDRNHKLWVDLLWIIREVRIYKKDKLNNAKYNDNPKGNSPHYESKIFREGRDLIKKGGKYLFDDK
ncbi:hypothetical protein [Bacteroides sedimenti]